MKKLYVVSHNNGELNNFIFKEDIKINQNVIITTAKGKQIGKIVKIFENDIDESLYENIVKIVDKNDLKIIEKNNLDESSIVKFAKKLAIELQLKMSIVNVKYSFDRTYLLINFYAADRVDFREYAKKMALKYKTRIELRQIGARDRSKVTSGIGVCGQKLCCSRCLNEMESVTINMAKNQNLSLNPSKINGNCNRLMCCLCYEDENYSDIRSKLPKIGENINYNNKDYTVKGINVLKEKVVLFINKEKVELSVNEYN